MERRFSAPKFSLRCSCLRVNSAHADGMRHAIDCQHVCGNAVVDAVRFRETHHIGKRFAQDEIQLLIDNFVRPEVTLTVLHPLEVRRSDAAGVGQNVWNHKDSFVREDVIGGRGGWAICAFADDLGFDLGRVLAGDYIFRGGWNQDVALGDEQLLGVCRVSAWEAYDGFVAVAIFEQILNVDAVGAGETAVVLGDANDLVSGSGHELGRLGAHVAKALNNYLGGLAVHSEFFQRFVTHDHHAAASGFAASARPADVGGLDRHYGSHGLAHVHGVCVHHPRHGLLVGVHVGSGNDFFGSNEFDEFGVITGGG